MNYINIRFTRVMFMLAYDIDRILLMTELTVKLFKSILCTDSSTETFWESGDEDKCKARWVTMVTNSAHQKISSAFVHVDNTRDINVGHFSFILPCMQLYIFHVQITYYVNLFEI